MGPGRRGCGTAVPRQSAPGRAQRLAEDAAEAAELRRWQTHPDVVALRVERVRAQVDRLCWAGIVLGLAFTTANVQWFAAAGAEVGSLPWLTAWLLDPTVCLVLLAILRAEQVTARYQVHTGGWVRAAKWLMQSGRNDGLVVVTGAGDPAIPAELLGLLDRLRAQVSRLELPRRAVIEDNLAELTGDVLAVRERGSAAAVAEVAKSRWAKIRSLLAGVAQLAPLVHAISGQVGKLFG